MKDEWMPQLAPSVWFMSSFCMFLFVIFMFIIFSEIKIMFNKINLMMNLRKIWWLW